MTAHTEPVAAPLRTLSVKNKVGLVLAALFGLGDLSGPFTVSDPQPGENGPPAAVLVAAAVLGLITIVAVVWMWRTANRAAGRIVAGTRILSVLTSLPAFFVGGVPTAVVALVAVSVVLTVVCVVLVLAPPKPAAA